MVLMTPLAFLLGEGVTQKLLLLAVSWLVVIVSVRNIMSCQVVPRTWALPLSCWPWG